MQPNQQQPKILALSGSLKAESLNQRLVKAAAQIATEQGADVNLIALRDYPLPLFNEEIEHEENPILNDLRGQFAAADGLLIASPEYNGSLTPALKNVIDWVSRPNKTTGYTPRYARQTAAIIATSPGGLGGLRGLTHVREILTNLGTLVVPSQVAVPNAYEAFDENGKLINSAMQDRLAMTVEQFLAVTQR